MNTFAHFVAALARGLAHWPRPVATVVLFAVRLLAALVGLLVVGAVLTAGVVVGTALLVRSVVGGQPLPAARWRSFGGPRAGTGRGTAPDDGDVVDVEAREVSVRPASRTP